MTLQRAPRAWRLRRRAGVLALPVALAIPVTAACADGQAHHQAPKLVLAARDPVRVMGSHFAARARVRVTVVAGVTQFRKATTSARGTFTATFGTVVIDRCTSWTVSAQQRGHAPVVIRGAKPQCPPA